MQKTIWPVLIVAAVLGAAILIGLRSASTPLADKAPAVAPGAASITPATASTIPDSGASASSPSALTSSSTPAAQSPATSQPAQPAPPSHPAPVTKLSTLLHIHEEIDAAADATTPESLALLVSYASDDNADVRTPALNGLIRRGDPDAAPFLRAAAKKTDSSEAIIAMLKTADYLELPSATLHEIAAMPKPPKTDSTAGPPAKSAKPAAPAPEDKP